LTVALTATAGTLLAETLNYSVFKYLTDTTLYKKKISQKKIVSKLIDLFNRKPFVTLLVVAFTPIPFYPFRFLVVMAHYPIWKYLLALFLARTPRFFLLSLAGQSIKIPDSILVIIFVVLIAAANIPLLSSLIKKKKELPLKTFIENKKC
jgi:ribonucleoside-triphosphate reductase